jgi:hypothetical protein
MNAIAEEIPKPKLRLVAGTVERRWRLGALLGLAIGLILAAYGIIVLGPGADANQMVTVTRAAKAIRAGTTITADELTTGRLRTTDPSLLSTLLLYSNRGQVVGQIADADVAPGDLVPADIVSTSATGTLWKLHVGVRSMPADLAPGDHVALLVTASATNGGQVDIVFMQDVRVLAVGSGAADLWIPAKLVPQVQWYEDHGGIALAAMQPGSVQNQIPAAGGS